MSAENEEKLASEILRQTERRIDVQLQVATSRDQRSLVVAAFSIASLGMLLRIDGLLQGWYLPATMICFTMASVFAAISALPREHHGAGYHYQTLEPLLSDPELDHATFLRSLAAKNDEYINANTKSVYWNTTLYRAALILFSAGLSLGILGRFVAV